MRHPPSEKQEIIRLIERSHLPVKRTLAQLGIPRTSFYRWYDRYLTADRRPWRTVARGLAGSGTGSPMR